ncbi:MAG: PAS domain S-box protein, partial [Armatimonadota bacterium]
MKENKNTSDPTASLRQRAVEKLKAVAGADYPPVAEPVAPRLVQELQIHQIELEMQNEELRQSHLAVEKGLEQYSELYDFAPVGYFTLDFEGNIRQGNLLGASLLGVDRSRLAGRRFGLYVMPESLPQYNAFLNRVFESHARQTSEVALLGKNSTTLYVRIDGIVSRDRECRLAVMDITAHKQMEDALLSLKVRLGDHDVFSVLVERAADGFWLLDKQFYTVYVNPAMEAMLGYAKSEMLGRSWYDFGDPEWTARARELEKRRESGVGEPHDFLFIHKSGRKVLTRIATTPLYDKDGSFDGAIGVLSDITRQKEAEEALRIKDLLNTVAQSSGLGICLINPDYTIAWYNDVHSQWYGALEKTKGRNCFEVFEGRDAICSECPVRVSFETGATTMTERSGITTSVGVNRTITLSTAPIFDADGNVLQVVETTQDITVRKQAEEARALTARLLLEIGTPGDFHECMSSLTSALQSWLGCEAIGIRLQDGDDYPYYETHGFPSEFIQEENLLCAYDQNNQVVKDSAGNPILECMCGNILCGRFDPDKPFFTPRGSFWSNGTTALLASTTDADRQTRTRNRCNGEGYESVALIPLRIGKQVFGLLQFNDHRTNRFTLDLIEQIESLADSLAIALSRRQTEEALRKSEEWLQLAYRSAGAGTWEWDMTSQHLNWSREFYTLFGLNPEESEASFDTWRSSLHPDDLESAFRVLQNAIQDRIPLVNEYRIIHPDGKVHWISALGDTIYDLSGQPVRMAGICTDITVRKQAEEALQKSEARLKTIFEESPLGIALIDSLTGQVYSANPMFAKIAGRTIEEMERIDWMSITHPDDVQKDLDNMALLNSGQINGFQMEKRYIHPDGTAVWINLTVTPVYVQDKTQPRHLAMIEDITARKQADEALRAASLYSRNLIETSLDPMVTISAKGKITDVNKATESITGVSRDRLIGSDFADYFAQPETARAGYLRAFELGQIADYPLAIRHASGAVAQVLYNVSVYRDDEGKVQGVFAAARDVS